MNNTTLHTDNLKLYHFDTCPYCARVRNAIGQLGLDIEFRNIHASREFHAELVREGGKGQVPALRIEADGQDTIWLYESDDIIRFLQDQFGQQTPTAA